MNPILLLWHFLYQMEAYSQIIVVMGRLEKSNKRVELHGSLQIYSCLRILDNPF